MRRAGVLFVVLAALAPLPLASAAAKSDGLDATITDIYKFKMRLKGLTFNTKPAARAGVKALKLDHIPLVSGTQRLHLWLAQIATAEFSPKGKGRTEVKAVLQGQGDKVTGLVHKTSRCFFEGVIAEGERKGRRVRFPLAEVKALEVHTEHKGAARPGKAGEIIPMPGPDEDVLWVSSVPLGAQVFAKPFDCKAALVWKDDIRIGETPLKRELGPGKYAVKVLVPQKLAQKLRPSTKLGEDSNPFECDWGKVTPRKGENVVASVTYTVIKREGKAATLISLFQRKGLTLDEVVDGFPEGDNFQFNDKKLEGALLYQEVPKTDIPKLLDALHRGGKIIWHGEKKSLMIELTPGPDGWKIGGAMRPKEKKKRK